MKALALSLLFLAAPLWACEGLTASAGWVRAAPPGASVLAGYLRLHNDSDRTVLIHRARSLDFAAVDFHQSAMQDGLSRMLMLDALTLPGRSILTLAPGGLHLMLREPQRALKAGDSVRLRLYCSPEDWMYLELPVRDH